MLSHIQTLNDLPSTDIRIFKERQHDTSDYKITLFIVRPKPSHTEVIAKIIKDEMNKLNQRRSKEAALKQHGIIFVPRGSRFREKTLKEKNVQSDTNLI